MKRLVFVTLIAGGLVGGSAWGLLRAEFTQLHDVRVMGLSRATDAQIRHLAGLVEGEPLVLLELEAATARVRQHPWVAEASMRRIFPDTVLVQVEERQVRALVMLERLYLVDATGEPFRIASPPDLDHPLLTGIPAELARDNPQVARRIIADGLGWLEAVNGHAGIQEAHLSEIRFDAMTGYTLALRNGGEVRLGFRDHTILDRLDRLAAEGLDLSRPHRVDLAYDTLAVVTPL